MLSSCNATFYSIHFQAGIWAVEALEAIIVLAVEGDHKCPAAGMDNMGAAEVTVVKAVGIVRNDHTDLRVQTVPTSRIQEMRAATAVRKAADTSRIVLHTAHLIVPHIVHLNAPHTVHLIVLHTYQ